MNDFIKISGLGFSYGPDKQLFQGFDFRLRSRENWVVLGPSGSGKSTLLLLMAGLLKPDKGVIEIAGQKLLRPRPETGLVLQDYGLLPWENLKKNIELGFRVRGFYGPDGKHSPRGFERNQADHDKALETWTRRLGIADLLRQYPSQVSGGQRRRAALARTLVMNPDLVLMDEPFASLDLSMRHDLYAMILELQQQDGFTSVIVTHQIEEALVLGQKILVLHQGVNQKAMVVENPDYGQMDFLKIPRGDAKARLEKQLKTGGFYEKA